MAGVVGFAFIPYYNHLMKILESDPNLKKTTKGIFAQMGYAAGGAAVGGIVLGPPGAMLGGVVGSVVGYAKSDDYDSLLSVLQNMGDAEKAELVNKVQELVGSSSVEALISFVGQQINREMLVNLVSEFSKNVSKGG